MSSSRSVSAAKTGAATGLLLPPADDPVWGSVPLALRQNLSVPAHGLVNPARGGLAEKSGRPLRLALSAAAKMRTTGAHWHVLLIAPRAAFGGPTSDRAGRAYALLQQVVVDYLRPALAARAGASGKAPAEQPPTAPAPASTPAAPAAVPAEPTAAPESADGFLPDPAAAPDTVSAAGPEGGAVEEAPHPFRPPTNWPPTNWPAPCTRSPNTAPSWSSPPPTRTPPTPPSPSTCPQASRLCPWPAQTAPPWPAPSTRSWASAADSDGPTP
ncbi:hypothetical protein [Streptomyces sp. NBC_00582]|uniref:hypothetical protein n=1 Tax=Streptomyces sp. NBC_00582 TaxID=2975783 RepID=UPI002E7FE6B3|nr:hypothetical protein [Streptomyces sp. NBC_00582]WUB68293.1 hypothetical protein OG852_49145 [Streptomyces sp. NBC_00582]